MFTHLPLLMTGTDPGPPSSRRACLRRMAACGVAAAMPLAVQSQERPAYAVSSWSLPQPVQFELVDTAGKTWKAADLAGRATLLNFWASWCEPCRAEMPTLQQIAELYGSDKLLVLAINFKEPATRALQFAKSTGLQLPVLLDTQGKAAQGWGVKVFPSTLMVDRAGRAQRRVVGQVDWTSIAAEQWLSSLMKA
jgi:thiol-disulfide isomerase/thioredoxin